MSLHPACRLGLRRYLAISRQPRRKCCASAHALLLPFLAMTTVPRPKPDRVARAEPANALEKINRAGDCVLDGMRNFWKLNQPVTGVFGTGRKRRSSGNRRERLVGAAP